MQGVVNPKPFLMDLIGKQVVVKLKWGMEYKGEWLRLRRLLHHPLYLLLASFKIFASSPLTIPPSFVLCRQAAFY